MKQPNLLQRLLRGLFARGTSSGSRVAVLPTEDVTVTCLGGQAWITMENDRRDYLLSAGNHQKLEAARHPVISVGGGSRIEIRAA